MSVGTQNAQSLTFAKVAQWLRAGRLPVAILVVLLVFAIFEPRVISRANLVNISVQCSYLAVFALAQCVVILTRGFDLSLGFNVSLVSVLSAMTMVSTGSVLAGIFTGFVVGGTIGLANGLLIGGIGLNPLVMTLGMANVIMALAATASDGFPVSGLPNGFSATFAQGTVLGIPVQIIVVVLLFALGWFLLHATRLGRGFYIIGANPRAAIAAGINRFRGLLSAYTISALITATGALLLTARTGSGEPNLGGNLTLEAIAAAVVGGAKLSGGEGGIRSAILGALFVTVLSNGMNLVQIDGYIQQICLGVIIIVSLIISRDILRH